MNAPTETAPTHPFDRLTPEVIMAAVESLGHQCDGRLLALNSYENRVYQVGIEDSDPLIAKFYRPDRWNDRQILEEHGFSQELAEQDISVVPPLINPDDTTLGQFDDFRIALFRRRGGRAPELDNLEHLETLGKVLGRMHLTGAARPFALRPRLDVASFGQDSVSFILANIIPADMANNYRAITDDLLTVLKERFQSLHDEDYIRTHGDCHVGNILWRDDLPHFVDFDDARMAPAIQDLWMLLSGDRPSREEQLRRIVKGYRLFNDFEPRQLQWIEPLRTLRMLHFSAWLARRWDDPAFPPAFPWFNTARYWGDHILELREQRMALNEPSIQLH